jgi:hypothetical protein
MNIKVCPFCSGKLDDSKDINHAETCYFNLLGMRGISQAELNSAWNIRAESDGLQDQIEKSEDSLFVKDLLIFKYKKYLLLWKILCFLLAILHVFVYMTHSK